MKHISKNSASSFTILVLISMFFGFSQNANAISFGICGDATYTNGSQTQTIPLDCNGTLVLPSGGNLSFVVCASGGIVDNLTLTSGPLPPGASFPTATGIQYSQSTFTWNQTTPFFGDITFYCSGLECVVHFDFPLPVELTSFTSIIMGNYITLNWQTNSEINNSEFVVERSKIVDGSTTEWISAGIVQGRGTTSNVSNYNFSDRGLNSGVYQYRLKQIDFNGSFEYHYLSNQVQIGLPEKFELSQNYPNPFNPSTVINYSLANAGHISLKVYNSSGIEVKTIDEGLKNPGYYTVSFDGKNLASGIYYYKLVSADFAAVKKMMLVK